MQGANAFMRKTEALKQKIEQENAGNFIKLYNSIGYDLLSHIVGNKRFEYNTLFENYKGEYIYLFRQIFRDVKQAGFGFDIRKQLNFDKNNTIELKAVDIELSEDEQQEVNKNFAWEFTLLLNNYTEELVNQEFLQSEADYFKEVYNGTVAGYERYVEDLQEEIDKTNNALVILSGILILTTRQKARQKQLEKYKETLDKTLKDYKENQEKKILTSYKEKFKTSAVRRGQDNAEFGTGQATSQIKELEYTIITQLADLKNSVSKVWWEKTQYTKGKPRINHLALHGTNDTNGLFYVGGYAVKTPRDLSLPASETVRCRCETEYLVKKLDIVET